VRHGVLPYSEISKINHLLIFLTIADAGSGKNIGCTTPNLETPDQLHRFFDLSRSFVRFFFIFYCPHFPPWEMGLRAATDQHPSINAMTLYEATQMQVVQEISKR